MPDPGPAEAGSIDDLYFTHAIDIPGHGTFHGEVDLRGDFSACLGHVSWRGKRVLDACALSGFSSFALEALGAEVVSYDRAGGRDWDLVPAGGGPPAADVVARADAHQARIARAYRFCHAALGSRAERIEGSPYDIPAAIGPVDAALVGALAHMRDPLRALHATLRLVRESAVVTGVLPQRSPLDPWLARLAHRVRGDAPLTFLPRTGRLPPVEAWWWIPPRTVVRWLRILGFGEARVVYHRRRDGRTHYAVLGRRTQANHAAI